MKVRAGCKVPHTPWHHYTLGCPLPFKRCAAVVYLCIGPCGVQAQGRGHYPRCVLATPEPHRCNLQGDNLGVEFINALIQMSLPFHITTLRLKLLSEPTRDFYFLFFSRETAALRRRPPWLMADRLHQLSCSCHLQIVTQSLYIYTIHTAHHVVL